MSSEIAGQADRASSPNPYVFIVGCPRSGTTLLERMVDAHPRIAIIHETHWIARYFKRRIGLAPDGTVTEGLVERLAEYSRFSHMKIDREDLLQLVASSDEPVSYRDFVSYIFDHYGRQVGKRLVGDKTTGGYLRNLSILHGLWPQARFVHLIRDGRSVCLSMLHWPKAHRAAGRLALWKESPVATTALWWKWQVRLGLEGGRPLGPERYCEVRYESLVDNPAEQCSALCDFLQFDYDPAMLRFNEGRTQTTAGLSANQAWLPPTPGLRNWRTQMAPDDVELFEALAGDLLSELGYPRTCDRISAKTAALARTYQDWWDKERPHARRAGRKESD